MTDTTEALERRALHALADGDEECALEQVEAGAARLGDPRLWQWTALLYRSIDAHRAALIAFDNAARLAPADAGIAHGYARVAFEAGIDARAHYARAQSLSPGDADVLIGAGAARLHAGEGEQVISELAALVKVNPMWLAGHRQLAQLRSLVGRPEEAARSLDEALENNSRASPLWFELFDQCVLRESFDELAARVVAAELAGLGQDVTGPFAAIAASEQGEAQSADLAFAKLAPRALPIWRIRHWLRTGRPELALPIIDRELVGADPPAVWPYADLAWRLVGDRRAAWLSRDSLVKVIDLGPDMPSHEALGTLLRGLHRTAGQYFDQSVRGGTQTDGPLFSRIEPEIQAVRRAVVAAVELYCAELPPPDFDHPTLGVPRDRRVRFSGSWSVRLLDGGRHANHVHPRGWISSALYVALPVSLVDQDGWLTLGQPQPSLGLDLPASRAIRPAVARLILFPSWMWHGTIPFAAGERLTIAFDVAPPR